MRARYFGLIFAMLLAAAFAAVAEPILRINEIKRPLMSMPEIVKAGDAFNIVLELEDANRAAGARLVPSDGAGEDVSLALSEPKQVEGKLVYSASVPGGTGEKLYDLIVEITGGSSDTQPHSVKVVPEFKKDFDFVHLTDIHFNVHVLDGKDMNRIRDRLLSDISKHNPEFVVFSGDLGLNPETYDVDYVYGYEQFIKYLTVPMHMVPGNHELYVDTRSGETIDGAPYWDAAYGPKYHSFDYGKMHGVGINSFDWEAIYRDRFDEKNIFTGTVINAMIGEEQWEWLKKDISEAAAEGKTIFAFTHIPIKTLQGGRKIGFAPRVEVPGPDFDKFQQLMVRGGVKYLFVGHMHYNSVDDYDGFTQVMTKAAGISGDDIKVFWGYRVVHVKDWKIDGWDIHEIGFKDLD